MKIGVFLTLVVFEFLGGFDLSDRHHKKLSKLVKKVWKVEQFELHNLTQLETFDRYELACSIVVEEQIKGYIVGRKIVDAYLNYFPVFLFDSSLVAQKAGILEMNTIKGAEISSKSWLKQFEGFQGDQLELGKQVDSMTGATLSSISMVSEIKAARIMLKTLLASTEKKR